MTGRDIIAVVGFLAAISGAAVTAVAVWPWGARAQRSDVPVVGFLITQPAAVTFRYLVAFRCGLREAGYIEGRHVRIEYRWSEGDDRKAKMLASELAARNVGVIASTGGLRSGHVMPGATSAIPALIITSGSSPDQIGSAEGVPGRNLTGVRLDLTGIVAKRLELLKELMPSGGRTAMLVRPGGSEAGERRALLAHSEARLAEHHGVVVLRVDDPQDFDRELDGALAAAVKEGVRGFIVSADSFYTGRRESIVALAAKHGLVALYPWRRYVDAGGFASYGPDLFDVYRQVGLYTGQILKGAQPGLVPVVAARKWELVINRKTAASLHLDIPPWIIARANEVLD